MRESKKEYPSIAVNFLYNTAYQIMNIILPLITVPYVSRKLGADQLGQYSYTYTVAAYFAMVAYLGFENYGNRIIAQNKINPKKLNRIFSGAYFFQLTAGGVAILAYILYLTCFARTNRTLAMIQGIYVGSQIFNISWCYFGLEKFKITAVYSMTVRILAFVAILKFVKNPGDLTIYTMICACSTLFGYLALWPGLRKHIKFTRVGFSDILAHAKGCLLLFFPVLVINIYRSMDKIMLGQISTMTEVALYTNADKIVEIPYGVITALGVVMLPRMTTLVVEGKKEKSRKYIEKSMRFMMFLACGMAFGMMATGEVFAPVFFGQEFMSCGRLIMIIAPMVIVRACANVVRTQYLLPNKRDKDYIISLLIGVLINLVVNALLIPAWRSKGAAVGTLLAESFVALYQIFACRKEIPVGIYILKNLYFIMAGLAMFLIVYGIGIFCEHSVTVLLIQILAGVFVYFLLAGLYLWNEEKKYICQILKIRAS
nr:flippase [uncultured Blautia sp.]